MKMYFETENDFIQFKNELKKILSNRQIRTIENHELKPSAVKMLLMNKENQPYVMLTKRSNKVTAHKGQISFPGGAFDNEDEDILNTAYRETFEEIGIPAKDIEYIGRFDDYISIYGFHVACFIGAINYPYTYTYNKDEIDECLEAPLSIFTDQNNAKIEFYNHMGHDYKIFHYFYNNYEIWGMTARILTDFCKEIITPSL